MLWYSRRGCGWSARKIDWADWSDLIRKITDEHKLDKAKVEQLAQDRFGKGVKALNKLEASGLIEELLEQTGQAKPRSALFQKAGVK